MLPSPSSTSSAHISSTNDNNEDQKQPTDAVPSALTPLRAHYLKKSLISLQFARELETLTNVSSSAASSLSYLGPPFTPPPKGSPVQSFPFIRFIFQQFVLTFPFFAEPPKDFFPLKLQPFLASLMSREIASSEDFDNSSEDPELASRRQLLAKIEKNLSLLMTSATKLVEPEEFVRLSQKDLDRLEAIAQRRQRRLKRLIGVFDVNIVCVRTVAEKGRFRSRVHEVRDLG